ncbi:MAG: FG-GAP repeat protein [Rickettsiales bacterium]
MIPILDLDELNGTNGFALTYNTEGAPSRISKVAGDINGDGIDDMVFGFPSYKNSKGSYVGAAFVVFGNPLFSKDFGINSLNGLNGFVFEGKEDEFVGNTVSISEDINGDGISEVLVTSNQVSNDETEGQSYVIYGSRAEFPAIFDADYLNGTTGFVIHTKNRCPYTNGNNYAAISLGDINNDGIGDIVIGAPCSGSPCARVDVDRASMSCVIYGNINGFSSPFSADSLNGSNGFVILDRQIGIGAGEEIASGDINGDGINDIVLSAPYYQNSGEVYVVFGNSSFPETFRLSDLNGTNGFTITGPSGSNLAPPRAGYSLSTKRNVVNHELYDIVIGVFNSDSKPVCTTPSNCPGAVYVVYGNKNFPPVISLESGYDGYRILGTKESSTGSTVGAGDFNSDGIDDIMFGAEDPNEGKPTAYVVFGNKDNSYPSEIIEFERGEGIKLLNLATDPYPTGSQEVANVGDINNGGIPDMAVVIVNYDNEPFAYVIFGERDITPSSTPSATPTPTGTPTPSITPTSTPSETPSITPTASPTASSSPTPTPTETPSESAVVSPSNTGSGNSVDLGIAIGASVGSTIGVMLVLGLSGLFVYYNCHLSSSKLAMKHLTESGREVELGSLDKGGEVTVSGDVETTVNPLVGEST